ncbi:MAG TPA: glycoside hydrolase family 2 TIM barrel-domain containing protein [Solirubrobacteraceae bacterium]|nr:glycoside hydrolase family 2 TIM barrel-domain containing protein [Solirubrobacteraceae bacterium]
MSRRLIAAIGGFLGAIGLVAVAWFVAVSSASPDPAPNSVVLAPHGGSPTVYAGAGEREQLSGRWRFRKDATDTGVDKGYQTGRFGGGELVDLPFVPDATRISGRKGLYAFRGMVGWYRTHIDVPTDGTYAIRFESVNHRASVYVDGKLEAEHKGEYLPFEVRVPLTAGMRHTLVVRADWRGPAAMKRDGWHRLWFNFGGINRGVSIRRIAGSEITYPEMNTTLTGGVAVVDLKLHLRNNLDARQVGVTGRLTRGNRTIALNFPAEPLAKGGTEVLQTQARVENPELWSPESPALWELELEVAGETTYRARVGLREVRTDGAQLLLNGKPIRLRGASIHEDVFGRGDALRPADQDRLVDHLEAIDANATRSQHPIDPGLLDRFDAAGIMVWQGVGPTDAPGSWTSKGQAKARTARERTRASVRQGQLHPSIITWNLANEVAGGGHPDGQIPYIQTMANELHRIDPSRPVALDIWGAHPPKKPEPIYRNIDMIGWTNYIGWYESTNASAAELRKEIKTRLASLRSVFPKKVIAVTEFGAEANGRNATTSPGGYAFQAHLLDLHLSTYASIPNLAGALIWNLRDFAVAPSFYGGSIKKLVPKIRLVRGLNQKGLFDVRYKAKPSVSVVNGRFAAQAAADGP